LPTLELVHGGERRTVDVGEGTADLTDDQIKNLVEETFEVAVPGDYVVERNEGNVFVHPRAVYGD